MYSGNRTLDLDVFIATCSTVLDTETKSFVSLYTKPKEMPTF